MQHCDPDDALDLSSEAVRIAKPGGKIAVVVEGTTAAPVRVPPQGIRGGLEGDTVMVRLEKPLRNQLGVYRTHTNVGAVDNQINLVQFTFQFFRVQRNRFQPRCRAFQPITITRQIMKLFREHNGFLRRPIRQHRMPRR